MTRNILLGLCLTLTASVVGYLPSARAQQDAQAKKYTPEQVAAAKKLAVEVGGRLKEDGQGNVISIDMAAGRTWADDYQMEHILVFPMLATLVVEGPGITNQLIPRIAEQSNLTSLTLKNTFVDDDGVMQLTGLKALKVIDLRVAPLITDRAMESLVKMPSLRAVRLVGGNITDQGVATVLQTPLLSELDVRNCRRVTKAGIEKAAAKKSLRVLKLGGSTIDDAMLDIVAGMDNLTSLSLENGTFSDAGVAKLSRLPLEELNVKQTAITDASVDTIAKLTSLKRLVVTQTRITTDGAQRLHKALPGCEIRVD
jgi:internalin A